jgi:hypothetical protein
MATAEPYRACTPKPFTRAERDSTTILFGGLHWRFERVLQAVLENYLDAHPEMKCATYRVPHAGAAGVAADLVLHVAARTGRRAAA